MIALLAVAAVVWWSLMGFPTAPVLALSPPLLANLQPILSREGSVARIAGVWYRKFILPPPPLYATCGLGTPTNVNGAILIGGAESRPRAIGGKDVVVSVGFVWGDSDSNDEQIVWAVAQSISCQGGAFYASEGM
jgi:hypothetical protein